MKPNTIHSKEYCEKRIKEIKLKNKGKEDDMSLGDIMLLEVFEDILKKYIADEQNTNH